MKKHLYALVGAVATVVPSVSGLAALPVAPEIIPGYTYVLPSTPETKMPQRVNTELSIVETTPILKLDLPVQPSLASRIRSLKLATTRA